MTTDPLSNPAWHSLQTRHVELGACTNNAARYHPDISVFAAVTESGDLTDLIPLLTPGDVVVLLSPLGTEHVALAPFEQISKIKVSQLVCHEPVTSNIQETGAELGPGDAEQMLALARSTDPGPFSINTRRMGRYVGVFEDGELIAMAGERFRLPGWTEISAVCTAEQARGRGLAKRLMANLMHRISARGDKAFLHVRQGSPSEDAALHAYMQLGFVHNQTLVGQVFRYGPTSG